MRKMLMLTAALGMMAGDSLLAVGEGGAENVTLAMNIYSCQRARTVGDILTVLVAETTKMSKTDNISTSKDAKAKAKAPMFGSFGFPDTNAFTNAIAGPDATGDLAFPSYEIEGASSFKGVGAGNSSEQLTASYGVRVVDKLDNGILVVRGERRIQIKNESVNMVLTGLVRVRDITADNTILSSQVSDAHIYYENGGEITRGSNPGWVWRIFQWVNPW